MGRQTGQRTIDFHERILGDILGLLGVAQQAKKIVQHRLAQVAKQRLEALIRVAAGTERLGLGKLA